MHEPATAAPGRGPASPRRKPARTPRHHAYDTCGTESAGALIADEESTLIIDGFDCDTVGCLPAEPDTPERVTQAMDSTRALKRRVTNSWDSFTASWSHHPDTGLDLAISIP